MRGQPPLHCEVHQRDDGLYEVSTGDTAAGPLPSYAFAASVPAGTSPEPKPAPALRRFKLIRELRIASA